METPNAKRKWAVRPTNPWPWPRPLRIALISTSAVATPPKAYGGTELVIAELAKELVQLGHEVTVFATADSTCAGEVRALFHAPVWPPNALAELRHATFAWSDIAKRDSYDIVHVNSNEALAFAKVIKMPTVATIHMDRVEDSVVHFLDHPDVGFVAISERQAELSPEVPFCAVIHHGLSIDRFPAGDGNGNYCAFLGRFAAEKAPHVAIDVARRAGVPLRMGGGVHPLDVEYYEQMVRPRLGDDAVRLGELGHEKKVKLLSGAKCLVFPICWEEPFGLVMIESMLVGTPVVAFPRGSAAEVIEEGVTGYLVHSQEEMVERIRNIGQIDRKRCRERAREKWSSARMAREYAELYCERIALAQTTFTHREKLDGAHDGSTGLYETLHTRRNNARAGLGG